MGEWRWVGSLSRRHEKLLGFTVVGNHCDLLLGIRVSHSWGLCIGRTNPLIHESLTSGVFFEGNDLLDTDDSLNWETPHTPLRSNMRSGLKPIKCYHVISNLPCPNSPSTIHPFISLPISRIQPVFFFPLFSAIWALLVALL